MDGFSLLCSALLVLLPCDLLAQNNPVPVRDPNALALVTKSLQAMTAGTALTDITLQGSATYIAGSDQELGAATLVALGNQQSRVTLKLTKTGKGRGKGVRSLFLRGRGDRMPSWAEFGEWISAAWFTTF